jgi:hypothetical protein
LGRAYSPILGLVTAAVELGAAVWAVALLRRGRGAVVGLCALLLAFLAGYQILEVVICWGGLEGSTWLSRVAFIDVTFLPPLTSLLLARLWGTRRGGRALAIYGWVSLALALVFAAWIAVEHRFVNQTLCAFLYARYRVLEPWFHVYGGFYELTQIASVFIAVACLARAEEPGLRADLGAVALGTLGYLIPSLLVGAIAPRSAIWGALPSVMCHFALFYALGLIAILRREAHVTGV